MLVVILFSCTGEPDNPKRFSAVEMTEPLLSSLEALLGGEDPTESPEVLPATLFTTGGSDTGVCGWLDARAVTVTSSPLLTVVFSITVLLI